MIIARQLGRYHLLDRLAVGGMAEIYRAKTFDSRGEEHMVAIKRVLRHLSDDDDFLQMLVDEAKIASILDHPNIARTYEFVRAADEYFIAMEYVDGRDLRSILDRLRIEGLVMPAEDAAYVMMRVLEALHFAHQKCDGARQELNIVHRDVSPSNVIVSFEGQVKLCDFGIAKARHSRVQTRVGVIKGKVKYMSPEQAMGRPLDGRSDVFSAGSCLYELLTKQPPFQAEDEMALIFRVRDAKFVRPSRWDATVPTALERILRKTMSRSRNSRYQTALEAADALRSFLDEVAPDYSPSLLGRRLTSLFAEDIAEDQTKLSEFVIKKADPNAVGTNLLAEVLGEGAAYTQFTAAPLTPEEREDLELAAQTRLLPRVPAPESRLPPDVNLHDVKTEIIDHEERLKRIVKRKNRPRPGAQHHQDSRRDTQAATVVRQPLAQTDTEPNSRDELHAARTRIIDTLTPGTRGEPSDVTKLEQPAAASDTSEYDDGDTRVDSPPTGVKKADTLATGPPGDAEEDGAGDLHAQSTRIIRPGSAVPSSGPTRIEKLPDFDKRRDDD